MAGCTGASHDSPQGNRVTLFTVANRQTDNVSRSSLLYVVESSRVYVVRSSMSMYTRHRAACMRYKQFTSKAKHYHNIAQSGSVRNRVNNNGSNRPDVGPFNKL